MIHVLAVLALVLIALCAWQGWRAGLLRRVLELAGVVASFFFATAQAGGLGAVLVGWTGASGRAALYLGWIALFLLGLLATRLLAALAARMVQLTVVGWVDRLGGLVCGLLIGVLLASVLLNLAARLPGGAERRAAFAAHPVNGLVLRVAGGLSGIFRDVDVGEVPRDAWNGLRSGAEKAAGAAGEAAARAAERFGPHPGVAEAVRSATTPADSGAAGAAGAAPPDARPPAGR